MLQVQIFLTFSYGTTHGPERTYVTFGIPDTISMILFYTWTALGVDIGVILLTETKVFEDLELLSTSNEENIWETLSKR